MAEVQFTVTFKLLTCADCGIQFAVPEWWATERRRDHRDWYCPNGHTLHFPEESDIERLEREKRETQARLNEEQHLRLVVERERDKAIRAKKRMETRVSRGVCLCCNRTFDNLARHMESKHKQLIPGGNTPRQLAGGASQGVVQ